MLKGQDGCSIDTLLTVCCLIELPRKYKMFIQCHSLQHLCSSLHGMLLTMSIKDPSGFVLLYDCMIDTHIILYYVCDINIIHLKRINMYVHNYVCI